MALPRFIERFIEALQTPTSIAIFSTILIIFLSTRFISGGQSKFSDGLKSAPAAPYWVPILCHLPQIYIGTTSTLRRFRNLYSEGLFSIRLISSVHNLVFKPALSESLLSQPDSVADKHAFVRRLMVSNFGLSSADLDAYDKATAELEETTKEYLSGPHLEEITKNTSRYLKHAAADLVSFNSFPIDHSDWERLANAERIEDDVAKGESIMEVDYAELINNFVTRTANASVFGTDFVENFPEIWHFFWNFDTLFLTLAMNVPIWFPWPASQRARFYLRKLRGYLWDYHDAWEKDLNGENKDPKWQDFYTASPLIKARVEIFRKHKMPIGARAACDLALLWSINASSAPLVSWCVLELSRDPVVLEQVREEIAPCLQIVNPKNEFSLAVWVPPSIEKLDVDELLTKCPRLKAAYLETVRLYGGGMSTRWLKKDVTLKDGNASYRLEKGTYAHVVEDLHHSDPKVFPTPSDWQLMRHIKDAEDAKGKKIQVADGGSVKPYEGGLTLCNDSELTLRKVLLYTSVLISLYNFGPVNGKKWWLPSIVKGPVSSRFRQQPRVWVKRRKV